MTRTTKKAKWKRRVLWTALFLVVLAGILAALVLARFHFSNQDFPRLARWQGNQEPRSETMGSRPQIIGHRGSGLPATIDGKPLGKDGNPLEGNGDPLLIGNTETAILRGIEAKVDWIEIDIRESSDHRLVVFHDPKIDDKTKGKGEVKDLSLDALKAIEILVDPPERILALDEVFDKCHSDGRKWILDIKAPGIHKLVLKWVGDQVSKGVLSKDQVILFGRYEVLLDYKDSDYKLGYAATWGHEEGFGNRLMVLFTPSEIINRCDTLGCHYLVLPIIFANQSLVDEAKAKGLNVWLYDSEDDLDHKHSAGRGISGLIVDYPEHAMDCF